MGKQRKKKEKLSWRENSRMRTLENREKLKIGNLTIRIDKFDCTLRARYIAWIHWYNTTCAYTWTEIFSRP